ncbi:MAG: hypothetical protein GEU79_18990 [Acidimicrobiia bacterium]|nr:hypothetical protein [Acidimicrobiia bacterium]
MEVIPVVLIAHGGGPQVWSQQLEEAAELAAEVAGTWLLRIPGSVVEWAALERPDHLASLTRVGWLAGGWSDPPLGSLPPRLVELGLERERQAFMDAGAEAVAVWLGNDWDPDLPLITETMGLTTLFVSASRFVTPVQGPVTVDRHGTVAVVIPISDDPVTGVSARAADPGVVPEIATRSMPSFSDLVPSGERAHLSTPHVERPHDIDVIHRKMLRMANRLPDKLRPELVEPVLSAIQGANLDGRNGLRAAHTDLLVARRLLDQDRLRRDGWSRIRRRDWDADGFEEIVAETGDFSTVIDAEAGSIIYLDFKPGSWSVFAIANEQESPDSALLRTFEEERPVRITDWAITEIQERRGVASALLNDQDERATVEITLDRNEMRLVYTLDDFPAARLGPEFRLAVDPTSTEMRVDGSEWSSIDETMSSSGHRFRIRDQEHSLLISSDRPLELFIRTTPDGVVLWANWLTAGDGVYPLTLEFTT